MSEALNSATGASLCAPGTPVYGEILEFLYREADILDSYRYGEWIELFDPDVHYVMPVRTTQFRAKGTGFHEMGFLDENFVSLQTRVKRLQTEFAWAETPPSRTRHFISNVLVQPGPKAGEFAVQSSYMVTRTRSDHGYHLFTGQREDVLRRNANGDLKIVNRRILMDQTVLTGTNLSVLF
jgi:PAH dioxygenase small subunit